MTTYSIDISYDKTTGLYTVKRFSNSEVEQATTERFIEAAERTAVNWAMKAHNHIGPDPRD